MCMFETRGSASYKSQRSIGIAASEDRQLLGQASSSGQLVSSPQCMENYMFYGAK